MANTYQDESMRKTLARYIRSQMDLAGITYKELCERLELKFNIQHNPATLRNKVNSGALGTQMFLFMLLCLEVDAVDMNVIGKVYKNLEEAD